MTHPNRLWIAGGIAPAILLLTLSAGALVTPGFDWPADPFSIVGTTGGVVATAFNVGLVLAGVAALPFGVHLWRSWSRSAGGVFALIGLSLVGAGLVPADPGATLHEVFGAGLFLGIWILLWVGATVDWRRRNRRAGLAAFVGGSATLGVWLPYDIGLRWAQIGYGGAELVSVLAFTLWSGWMAARLRAGATEMTADRSDGTTAGRREEAS